jgi:hypothetical protein
MAGGKRKRFASNCKPTIKISVSRMSLKAETLDMDKKEGDQEANTTPAGGV